jgi:hypothetical protein
MDEITKNMILNEILEIIEDQIEQDEMSIDIDFD